MIVYIFGWIFIVWFVILFLYHSVIYVLYYFTEGFNYVSVTRESWIGNTEIGNWYIFPAISIRFGKYSYVELYWLKWSYSLTYYVKTEDEEELEAEVRREIAKRKHES